MKCPWCQQANPIHARFCLGCGASGFKGQQVTGLPMLQVVVEPDRIARYGINSADVMSVVGTLGGAEATQIMEGQRRFPLVMRFPEAQRRDRESVGAILVSAPGGERVPLASLARIEEVEGPAEIGHVNGSRLILVEGNVRGRDIAGFVEDVRGLFERKVGTLPTGYRVEFGGQFENLERARLLIVVPLSLLLIFLLLFSTFNSVRQALLVFTCVPLAAVGGVFSLLIRGMPFNISAGVGFIALFGVAVLNGGVVVSCINDLRRQGRGVVDAVREGSLVKLRTVMTTVLVASFGFIPMALSTGAGAEVQRPLATVVIGGLVSSTLLTLFVLPVLYRLFEREGRARPEEPAAWADCAARITEAQAALRDAEAAVAKARDSGKAAAKTPLAKAKKQLLHAEAECKTDGAKDVRKNAEAGREAREAQGFAEEAKMLAEKL